MWFVFGWLFLPSQQPWRPSGFHLVKFVVRFRWVDIVCLGGLVQVDAREGRDRDQNRLAFALCVCAFGQVDASPASGCATVIGSRVQVSAISRSERFARIRAACCRAIN